VWRWPAYVQSYSQAGDSGGGSSHYNGEYRLLALQHAALAVVDAICFPCGALSLAAIWRWPACFKFLVSGDACSSSHESSGARWNGRLRSACLANLAIALSDAVIFPLAAVSLLAVWRWPSVAKTLSEVAAADTSSFPYYNSELRAACLLCFLAAKLDLFTLPLSVLGFLSLTVFDYVAKLRAAWALPDGEGVQAIHYNITLRFVALEHFGWFLLDVAFVPAFLLAVFSWRHGRVVRSMQDPSNSPLERRLIVLCEALCLLGDVMLALLALLVVLTGWRFNALRRGLGTVKNNEPLGVYIVVLQQFGRLLLDLPMLAIGALLSVTWRAPPLWRNLAAAFALPDDEFVDTMALVVGEQLAELLVDLLHIALSLALVAVPWRFLALLVVLFEPAERWPQRVRIKARPRWAQQPRPRPRALIVRSAGSVHGGHPARHPLRLRAAVRRCG
jgi:hypothetical protein